VIWPPAVTLLADQQSPISTELKDDSEDNDGDIDEDKGDVEDEAIEAGEDRWRSKGLHIALMVLAIDKGDDLLLAVYGCLSDSAL
jgi:hypothetical protein